MEIFNKEIAQDEKYKPLILKWLCKLAGLKTYHHNYQDQYIIWSVWDDQVSVTFDTRVESQQLLLSLLHPRYIGIPQFQTLKIVNINSFYLNIHRIMHIPTPEIIGHKLLKDVHHKDNEDGDDFFTYEWAVKLSDGTCVLYDNQVKKMDMVKGDLSYKTIIQYRAFIKFLESLPTS